MHLSLYKIQSDQKVSLHLTITIQKVTSNVQSVPHQSPDIYRHAKPCSRRPCSVKHGPHSECILWSPSSNHQLWGDCLNTLSLVHRDFFITLYEDIWWNAGLAKFLTSAPDGGEWSDQPQVNCPRYPMNSWLGGSQRQSKHLENEKKSCALNR
jgi:hypothetical protein